jgi:integrase
MQDEVFHGARSRERIAPNLYRRTTKTGEPVFEVMFRDVDGRQRARRLEATSERAARRETRAILAGRDRGDRVVAAEVTLARFWQEEYLPLAESLAAAGRRSERGVQLYAEVWRLYLEPVLGDRRLGELEGADVAHLLRDLRRRGYAESTLHRTLVVLRALDRLARSRKLVTRSPLDELDPAEKPSPPRMSAAGRVLDETELAALVRHAPPAYRAVVTLLAYSGLRTSEALGLRWTDVNFVESELQVRFQLSRTRGRGLVAPKTRASERFVPLFPAVEQALVERLAAERAAGRGCDADLVFLTRRGTPYEHRNVASRGVEEAARRAGLGKLTPHDLRRSFCSLAGRRGVDPVEAAQLTGHSPDVWARVYARSFGKAQRDEARRRMLEHGFGAEAARNEYESQQGR